MSPNFADAVAKACAEIRAQGPWVVGQKPADKKALKKRAPKPPDLQKKLLQAVRALDLDEAKRWVGQGARPGEMFAGETLFEMWHQAAEGKPGSAAGPEIPDWLESVGVPLAMDVEAPELTRRAAMRALGGFSLGEARALDARDWARSWIACGKAQEPAMAAIARRWAAAHPAEAVPVQAWVDNVFEEMLGEKAGGFEILGAAVESLGAALSPDQWEKLAEAIGPGGNFDIATEDMERVLRASPASTRLTPSQGARILAYAIATDNLEAMEELARRCPGLGWRLEASGWGEVDRAMGRGSHGRWIQKARDEGRPLSAMHLCLARASSRVGATVGGMDCFRALARVPGAVADASAHPIPELFAAWSARGIAEEIAPLAPGLLDPDARGRSFALVWASEERFDEDLAKLLSTPWAGLVGRPDAEGESPLGLARKAWGAGAVKERGGLEALERAYARWEGSQMRSQAKRGARGAKSKRL